MKSGVLGVVGVIAGFGGLIILLTLEIKRWRSRKHDQR
jgi:hypothetical protein